MIKKIIICFFFNLLLAAASFGQPMTSSRLMLWSTLPLRGASTEQCALAPAAGDAPPDLALRQLLTERAVDGWSPLDGRWQIVAPLAGSQDVSDWLRDHCFVLAIDGRIVVRGVALSVYSARLTRIPTLHISQPDSYGRTTLQLTRGNYFQHRPLLAYDALNSVLGMYRDDAMVESHRTAGPAIEQGPWRELEGQWVTGSNERVEIRALPRKRLQLIRQLNQVPAVVASAPATGEQNEWHTFAFDASQAEFMASQAGGTVALSRDGYLIWQASGNDALGDLQYGGAVHTWRRVNAQWPRFQCTSPEVSMALNFDADLGGEVVFAGPSDGTTLRCRIRTTELRYCPRCHGFYTHQTFALEGACIAQSASAATAAAPAVNQEVSAALVPDGVITTSVFSGSLYKDLQSVRLTSRDRKSASLLQCSQVN